MKGYSETLDYLYGLEKFGMVFGLDNITWLLSLIGNPQDSLKTVHVAGTNGKGSVASMVSQTLRTAGYSTGIYTSPHLISFTERIAAGGEAISEEEVVELTQFMKERIDEADAARRFTFFDFTTALAFEYFKRKAVDIAVVEVGLGGRLDSTNVIRPLVTVITNVDFDHQDYLGTTIEEIAREKAGVVKDHVPVVTGAKGAALEIIKAEAAARTDLFVLGHDFTYKKKDDQVMWYRGIRRTFDDLSISLRGDHQFFNAALALCTLELLDPTGFSVKEHSVRKALASMEWPGRLELIRRPGDPLVLLDGAHNPQGVGALASYLRTHYVTRKKILVFGVMKDKDFGVMLKELIPVVQQTILTKPEIGRAALPADLVEYAPSALVTASVKDAVARAFKMAGEHDLIIITGSFYTLGEAKRLLDER
ncbi:MAG: folylpolyglutamate synthase/dihydrofolate synthase family protein [Syntrophorhabdales bacterium]